ncbi:MAG: cell division protein FtsQ/DivIB [Salinibacter sp.]
MNLDRIKTYGRLTLRLLGLGAVVGGVLALGLLGWQWQSSVTVGRVAVTGVRHAPPDTVRRLARVDSGTVMGTIDGALVADRVARHPWVKTAEVTKQRVYRTLQITVTERTPAALVVDASGRPAYYLDPAGYAMPLPDSGAADVPLVRGLDAEYHPLRRMAPPPLRAVLSALSESGADPLVAEVAVRPDSSVRLLTTPIGPHGVLPVRLGTGDIPAKLRRLRAFAKQVLASDTASAIGEIDLRFDGQIVTRTQPLDG